MREFAPGDRIDNFTIVAELHHGAMARIYRANERFSGRDYALKIPFDHILETPLIYYHFQNEERLAADLDHPHIVRFYTRNRSRPYSILEWVDGSDLRPHLDSSGPLPVAEVRRLGLQICTALEYLHNRRIAHLDLKPENLMLSRQGTIRLIDFGLARRLDREDPLASDFDMPRGTPVYAPPEVLSGEAIGAHSDIYSLGLVLYEMLTGRLPFARSSRPAQVKKRLTRPPAPPRRYRSDLTPQWQELLLTALERRPEKRYSKVAELTEALKLPEAITVTERGRVTGRLQGWRPALTLGGKGQSRQTSAIQESRVTVARPPQILGLIVDDKSADAVVERVKREALISPGAATLLTVVARRGDDQFTQYDASTRGTGFKKRLDRYVDSLRRYAIDPTVRICRGDVTQEILRVAADLPARILVLGASRRKGLNKMLRGRLSERLSRKAACPVVVAPLHSPTMAMELPAPGDPLGPEDLVEIDLFLVENWVAHLSWMANLTRDLLTKGDTRPSVLDSPCDLGRWIAELRTRPGWARLVDQIARPHDDLHATADRLAMAAAGGETARMKAIYRHETLPLSRAIRDGLQAISAALHRQSTSAGKAQLTAPTACPVPPEALPEAGPLSIMREIHAYFCDYPDGSPESCLLGPGGEVH
jgi:nucleotide-binding universal stress UspA family protein/tRNA A-37 threonylcarbamoyl transferase component Bud32